MNTSHIQQWRTRIAQLAAQLMAEHGIQDHSQAKRKAARQLGAPAHSPLPNNEEVDAALRAYQALFAPEVQSNILQRLRQQALEIMRRLDRFNPILTGGLVTGAITRHSDIELDLYGDASKAFEIFLLNADIPFSIEERPDCSMFYLTGAPAGIRIRFLPTQAQHRRSASRGEPRRVLNAAQLAALLDNAASSRNESEASTSAATNREHFWNH